MKKNKLLAFYDEEILLFPVVKYWAERFFELNEKYAVQSQGYTFGEYIDDPDHAERWIPIWHANSALMLRRSGGGKITIGCFLSDPAAILIAAQIDDIRHRMGLGKTRKPRGKNADRSMHNKSKPNNPEHYTLRAEKHYEIRGGMLFEPFHARFRRLKYLDIPIWLRDEQNQ